MDALERYIHEYSEPEEELLRELDRETHLRTIAPRMLSGPIQGELLTLLVEMLRPRRILEIGTFTGYSTLCMARGLDREGIMHTIEVDDELEPLAQSFFDRSPHRHKIRLHIGSALDIAPTLGCVFDLVFIDGDKREYPEYYRMLMGGSIGTKSTCRNGAHSDETGDPMEDGPTPPVCSDSALPPSDSRSSKSKPLVRSGSILVADNILWSGKVVQPVAHNDRHTQALLEFNRLVAADPRVENVILPLRDGLNLIRVR